MDEFTSLDTLTQAELVRKKEVKPIELIEAAIRRVESLNPKINAVVTPLFDEAIDAAKHPLPDGPLAGVPFLLKDLRAFQKGIRATAGCRFLKEYRPDHDSEIVSRYKRAGLIIIGRTSTPEFGLLPTTEPILFGKTVNPWNPSLTAGGSSGGSAAAVAAGMVAAAHGSDGGGSIRIPASCCGVFGFKPTRGRTPLGPDLGDILSGLIVEHAITRSVRDSAALLDAVAGPASGDPYWAPPPKQPFLEEVGAKAGRLRIAFTIEALSGVDVDPDCREAVLETARLCQDLGHEVVESQLHLDGHLLSLAFTTLWAAGTAWAVKTWGKKLDREPSPEFFEPLTWALSEVGLGVKTSADYLLAVEDVQKVSREFARHFVDTDLWLTPTLASPPVPLGAFDAPLDNPLQPFFRAAEFTPFTPLANASGQPAMSVPLYWNKKGIPIGSHFIGRFGDEATLFRLAAQLESARPWSERRPEVL